jgi:hypothetical protein
MKKKMNRVDLKIDEKTHWKGSHTNQHVRKEDPRQRTADHFIVGVSPMARNGLLSTVRGLVDGKIEVDFTKHHNSDIVD